MPAAVASNSSATFFLAVFGRLPLATLGGTALYLARQLAGSTEPAERFPRIRVTIAGAQSWTTVNAILKVLASLSATLPSKR